MQSLLRGECVAKLEHEVLESRLKSQRGGKMPTTMLEAAFGV